MTEALKAIKQKVTDSLTEAFRIAESESEDLYGIKSKIERMLDDDQDPERYDIADLRRDVEASISYLQNCARELSDAEDAAQEFDSTRDEEEEAERLQQEKEDNPDEEEED